MRTYGPRSRTSLARRSTRWEPAARAEFIEQVAFYEEQQKGLGRRFAVALREALRHAHAFPSSGSPWAPDADYGSPQPLRSLRLRRFPFRLFYLDRGQDLVVVAVANERQLPGYWQQRRSFLGPGANDD